MFMLACSLVLMAQSAENYKARLTAMAADARNRGGLGGSGSATATLAGSKLTVIGTFADLQSPAMTANLHAGVAAGVRGPAFGDLKISESQNGNISGTFDLTAQQVASLRKGGLYIEIHSEKARDGVLWGWLVK